MKHSHLKCFFSQIGILALLSVFGGCKRGENYTTLLPETKKCKEFEKSQLQTRIYLMKNSIHNDPLIRKFNLQRLFGLGWTNFINDSTTNTKNIIDIIFLESHKGKEKIHSFSTINRRTRRLIDGIMYNPDYNIIYDIYLSGSKNQNMEINLLKYDSSSTSIFYTKVHFLINKLGEINFINEEPFEPGMMEKLGVTQPHTGDYSFKDDSIKINLSLRNSPFSEFYDANFVIETPIQCKIHYRYFRLKMSKDDLLLAYENSTSAYSINVSKNDMICCFDNYTQCDYIFDGTFILAPVDSLNFEPLN